ncbi:hypothetical protein Tco_0227439, partial [Tanacetum coccineum]
EIPAETPTIPPVAPTLPHTSLFLYTDSSDSGTSKRPPSQDPYEVTVAQFYLHHPDYLADQLFSFYQASLLASRYPLDHSSSDHFSSDDSSSDSSPDSSSDYSSDSSSGHSVPDYSVDAPSTIFARPSHKRFRSPVVSVPLATPVTRALSRVRADLLPPRKRIRGAITAYDYDDNTEESYEAYAEPNINSDVQANIDVDTTTAEAAAT